MTVHLPFYIAATILTTDWLGSSFAADSPSGSAAGDLRGDGDPKSWSGLGFQDYPADWQAINRLHNSVLSHYNRNIRPVQSQTTPTVVKFQFHITHLESLNEQEQTLSLHGWFYLRWTDENVAAQWKNVNLTSIRLPQFYLWTPDIYLLNNAKAKESNIMGWNSWLIAFSNGTVIYDPVTSFTATCDFNFQDWPWDTQDCILYFGSWVYRAHELRFEDLPWSETGSSVVHWSSQRSFGSNWHITHATTENQNLTFPASLYGSDTQQTTWNYLQVRLKVQRNAEYLRIFVIYPVITTSLLTLLIFWIKGQAKFLMGMFTFLLEFLLNAEILKVLPPMVQNEPRLVSYCKVNLVITTISLICSVISLNIAGRSADRPPPHFLVKLLNHKMFRFLLCLWDKEYDPDYTIQLVDPVGSTDAMGIPAAVERKVSLDWLRISRALDSIWFFFFSLIYAISVCQFLQS